MSTFKKYICIALLTFISACAQQQPTPSHTHAGCKECAACCKEECAECVHCQQQTDCECPHCVSHHSTNKVAHELLHKKTGKYPACTQQHKH